MSLRSQAISQCPKCGHQHTVTIYKSLNTSQDPDLKAKLLSGELFLAECPDCGCQSLVSYDMLYHDPEQKLMLWMLPGGEPEGLQQSAIVNQAKAMGDYRLRLISNAGDLMEKVMIADAGLDDRCIELVKYVAGEEMPGVSKLHFYRMQDDAMVFSGVKQNADGQSVMENFGIGLNVYEDCEGILERNEDMNKEDGFERIDASWVANFLG